MLGLAQRYLSLLGRKRPSPQIVTNKKTLVDNDVDRGNAVNSDCDKESLYIYIYVYIYVHTHTHISRGTSAAQIAVMMKMG